MSKDATVQRQVLDYLNKVYPDYKDTHDIADTLGLHPGSVSSACARLVKVHHLVERVAAGIYRAIPADRLGSEPGEQPEATPVLDQVLDQEVYDVLDLLFPGGVSVRALPRVLEWVECTRVLLREVSR